MCMKGEALYALWDKKPALAQKTFLEFTKLQRADILGDLALLGYKEAVQDLIEELSVPDRAELFAYLIALAFDNYQEKTLEMFLVIVESDPQYAKLILEYLDPESSIAESLASLC